MTAASGRAAVRTGCRQTGAVSASLPTGRAPQWAGPERPCPQGSEPEQSPQRQGAAGQALRSLLAERASPPRQCAPQAPRPVRRCPAAEAALPGSGARSATRNRRAPARPGPNRRRRAPRGAGRRRTGGLRFRSQEACRPGHSRAGATCRCPRLWAGPGAAHPVRGQAAWRRAAEKRRKLAPGRVQREREPCGWGLWGSLLCLRAHAGAARVDGCCVDGSRVEGALVGRGVDGRERGRGQVPCRWLRGGACGPGRVSAPGPAVSHWRARDGGGALQGRCGAP